MWGRAPLVHITVGTHQFADWALLSAAHDCFLALRSVHFFDEAQHASYRPRRNDRDDAFDVGEVRTYAFFVDEGRLGHAKTHCSVVDLN